MTEFWECPPELRNRTFSRPQPERSPRVTFGGAVAIILASPLFLLGYAFAALFFVVPLYAAIAVFGETYTIIPDEQHELATFGLLLAVLTGWFFIRGIAKAVMS